MNLFNELKRRNVFRVGFAYLIGAWLLAQIADLLIDNIGAPDWVMKTLFVVLALGFFLALFFAWAFEMTPEGVKRESEVDRSQSITNVTGRKLDRSIIVILLVALGYFAWDKFLSTPQATPPADPVAVEEVVIDKSIAVLPFVNMSADADNEYFSDGLSEELLNLLAKVDGLKVAARTSSFKFKNSEADIAEIGQKLNVATVLEGSVRKSGNQARITAQLIKVDDGFHMWSETYDRELDNIFEVQDEIARAIVDALKLPLLGHDAKPLTSTNATENFAAYDLYLLGRHHGREYSEAGLKKAIEYFLAALEVDPSFASAYSGLADAYLLISNYGDLPQGEALELARNASEKALDIDPSSPEALTSMGLLQNNLGKASAAEGYFRKALEVNPNYVNALLWNTNSLFNQFRSAEALSMVKRAMNVDPLSHNVRRDHAQQLFRMMQYEESEREIQNFIDANPDDPTPYELRGDLLTWKGLPQDAIPMFQKAHRLRPGDIYMASENTVAGLQLDDENLTTQWLNEARTRGADGRWTRYAENQVMYAKGDFDGLLKQVDRLLESLPGQTLLISYKTKALMNLGKADLAEETLQTAMESNGYGVGQPLPGDLLYLSLQLANAYDHNGNTSDRDLLLGDIKALLQNLRETEPLTSRLLFISASLASIENDLPGALRELEAAVEKGFRNHWELIRDPVFKRWQKHPEFIAFHQGMLDDAARMRGEYYANNPAEKSAAALEGGH